MLRKRPKESGKTGNIAKYKKRRKILIKKSSCEEILL